MSRAFNRSWIVVMLWLGLFSVATAVQRFPPPQFSEPRELPEPTTPPPRSITMETVDVAVLAAALMLAAWLILKKRRRGWIVALMLFSLGYFGFWRQGCICPIGAIGNVTLAIFDASYALPLTVLAFFLLPLLFTLFFGRVFCGAVCPLGMVQDLVLIRPLRIPAWLESGLRLFAWLYLGLALLMAATASALVICRYDPFVAFFRLGANPQLWIISFSVLAVSLFVGRPYCRFLCPYGVILRQLGRLSKYRVTITPDECIHCRLCEDACPFGAIDKPTVEWPDSQRVKARHRARVLLVLLPVIILLGGWIGFKAAPALARSNAVVRLAERIRLEETGLVADRTDESTAFRTTNRTIENLYTEAEAKQQDFVIGSTLLGGAMGLLCGLTLMRTHICFRRDEYEAHRAGCVACGRCYLSCPREHLRRQRRTDLQPAEPSA
ncbi:MAG TPA: 4Fe-4S binding protein [Phycisphaerales bacterium]|nr:4Fe-4S binding protein [Phycisphaerales bacterium]